MVVPLGTVPIAGRAVPASGRTLVWPSGSAIRHGQLEDAREVDGEGDVDVDGEVDVDVDAEGAGEVDVDVDVEGDVDVDVEGGANDDVWNVMCVVAIGSAEKNASAATPRPPKTRSAGGAVRTLDKLTRPPVKRGRVVHSRWCATGSSSGSSGYSTVVCSSPTGSVRHAVAAARVRSQTTSSVETTLSCASS